MIVTDEERLEKQRLRFLDDFSDEVAKQTDKYFKEMAKRKSLLRKCVKVKH